MKPSRKLDFLLFVGSLLGSLALAEVATRVIGEFDQDGNFSFRGKLIRPYKLPLKSVRALIEEYRATPTSALSYDRDLGWVPRPFSKSNSGANQYNAYGIRSPSTDTAVQMRPDRGVLRIALFGDSYTHAYDVTYEDSWGNRLEQRLKASGVNAEVLNFGVGGYGMDQAFLRWQVSGVRFAPHIVIFGYHPGDVQRNVNLFRVIWGLHLGREGEIPFSKPRFVLDGEYLTLINHPTPSPEEGLTILENIGSWDLLKYEHWLKHEDYRLQSWQMSKLAATLFDSLRDRCITEKEAAESEKQFYALGGEAAQLAIAIVKAFQHDVERHGADFFVVYLPSIYDVRRMLKATPQPHSELLDEIGRLANVIRPDQRLYEAAQTSSADALFIPHYSPLGNAAVAEEISEVLLPRLRQRPEFRRQE